MNDKLDDPVPVLQLGVGTVGLELVELVEKGRESSGVVPDYKYVGFADRSGLKIRREGFSGQAVENVKEGKREGRKLSELLNSSEKKPEEIEFPSSLGEGVLVDVTSAAGLEEVYGKALENDWSVVVANKIPLTKMDSEEFGRFREAGIRYETTVGAGLPVISTLEYLQRQDDRVDEIAGILSGSLSFILAGLEEGKSLSEAVREAKRRGFTEPDPAKDLSGKDVERKALILARSLGADLSPEDIETEPLVPVGEINRGDRDLIEELRKSDFELGSLARSLRKKGRRLRYVARVSGEKATVGLEEVPSDSPLQGGSGTSNVIQFRTENYVDPPLLIQGPGAGPEVTAGGVFSEMNSEVLKRGGETGEIFETRKRRFS